MIKNFKVFLLCLLFIQLLLTGCKAKTISMGYIKTPDEIVVYGDKYKDEISKLTEERNNLKKANTDLTKQKEIQEKIFTLLNESTLQIDDKEFINKILSSIKNTQGKVIKSMDAEQQKMYKNKEFYDVQFIYSSLENHTEEEVKEGYISNLTIFYDGATFIPAFTKEVVTGEKIVFYEVKLPEEIIKNIKDYYQSNI